MEKTYESVMVWNERKYRFEAECHFLDPVFQIEIPDSPMEFTLNFNDMITLNLPSPARGGTSENGILRFSKQDTSSDFINNVNSSLNKEELFRNSPENFIDMSRIKNINIIFERNNKEIDKTFTKKINIITKSYNIYRNGVYMYSF